MNFLSLKHRKFVAGIVLMALVVPLGVGVRPQQADAFVVTALANIVNDFKEWVLDGSLGWAIANTLIAQMGNNIINWINSGFQGDPLFVSDPEQFLLGIANDASGQFIKKYNLSAVCDPYKPQILIALAQTRNFDTSSECTLLDAVDNIDAFLDDFSRGGWEGWVRLTQNPQNNIYGSYLIAVDEQNRLIRQAVGLSQSELNQNQGFFSLRKCKKGARALVDDSGEGEGYTPEEVADSEAERDSTGLNCAKSEQEVVTPGQAIIGSLNDSLGAPLNRLGNAKEITEVVLSGIMDALVKQLVLGGLRSLSGGGGDGDTNLYLDSFEGDKNTLLETIDETIAENEGISGSNETIMELLAKISETHTCYNEQRAVIRTSGFHPPNEFSVPTVEQIIAKQEILAEDARDIEQLISGARSEEAAGQVQKLRDLKERIILASEDGLIDPSSMAAFWGEYNEIRRNIDLQQRGQDIETVENMEERLVKIDIELERCQSDLERFNSYIDAPVDPIEVIIIENRAQPQ